MGSQNAAPVLMLCRLRCVRCGSAHVALCAVTTEAYECGACGEMTADLDGVGVSVPPGSRHHAEWAARAAMRTALDRVRDAQMGMA